MSFMQAVGRRSWLKSKLSNNFVRNLGWLGIGQIVIRISRLLTTVVLARSLSSYEYGLAALVLTTYEFVNIFTYVGITAKIIQVEEEKLEDVCNSAYWLNWAIFGSLFVIQCIAAFPIAWFYQDQRLIMPICVLAFIYLMGPIGNIQGALIRRENRLKIISLSNTLEISVGNVLTAIFAFLGFGMWAIILPRLLAYPIGVYVNFKNHPWRLSQGFTTQGWRDIFDYGRHFLGIALLTTLRNNLDYLIVGRFVGVQELGLYFFAFNAGLGISLTIINSITAALFPHLCALRSNQEQFRKQYFSSLKVIALIMIPFVFLQSSLAPFYVPIVFGPKWVAAIPILILICLSAIPRPFGAAASTLLTAVGKPNLSLRWDLVFTVAFAGALLIGVHWQAMGVAIAVLVTHVLLLPLFTVLASRYVFSAKPV
jgi:teichuronic acid exporter